MTTVILGTDVPPKSREDYYQQAFRERLGPIEVSRPFPADYCVLAGSVGAVGVLEITGRGGSAASLTRRGIRQLDEDLCKIDVIARGRVVVEQDGREAVLGVGDLTFVDLSQPAHWAGASVQTQAITVAFPRAMLPLRREEAARLTAVRIPGAVGTGALVSSLARQLPAHLDEHGAAEGVRLGTAVVDLLAVALAARLDRTETVPAETRRRALLQRVSAFIEEHLADPELSPDTIAAAHHISVRYLYKLFEAEGQGVAGWIWQRRLDRCQRDLLDPALRTVPVSAIAARWGFRYPGHFSRVFRSAYGLPPGEYRMLGNGPGPR